MKSSQARTLDSSLNKFKVWWYFLCKLNHEKIFEHCDITLEQFLIFCFGQQQQQQSQNLQTPQQQQQEQSSSIIFTGRPNYYPVIKQMSIACFIEMFGTKEILSKGHRPNEIINNDNIQSTLREIRHILETKGLEIPSNQNNKESIITTEILIKSSKLIFNSAFESTIMILENGLGTTKFFQLLWKNLFIKISNITSINDCYKIYNEFLQQFKSFLKYATTTEQIKVQCFNEIIQIFCLSNEFPLKFSKMIANNDDNEREHDENSKHEKLYEIIWNFTDLLIEYGFNFMKSRKQIEEIFENLYNINHYKIHVKQFWLFQINFMKFLMIKLSGSSLLSLLSGNDKNNPNQNIDTIKMIIWKNFTLSTVTYLNDFETLLEFRQNQKNLEILNDWFLWPLIFSYEKESSNSDGDNDSEFKRIWKNLAMIIAKIVGQNKFSEMTSLKLKELITNDDNNVMSSTRYCDVMDEFISCLNNKFGNYFFFFF